MDQTNQEVLDLSNGRYREYDEFAGWLQSHIIALTLEAGDLSLENATYITDKLISDETERIQAWVEHGFLQELVEMAYEVRTDLKNPFCPFCTPGEYEAEQARLANIIPVIGRIVRIEDIGPVYYVSLVAVVEEGGTPEFPISHRIGNAEKIVSFDVNDRTFDLYIAPQADRMKSKEDHR